ncbi:hypothetical protein [Prevotella pallens]|uniref:hypothetical protein n=1 Tax=Prevotella pallens TaxID=60133 RepID=UPI0028EBCE68|nr:hypothetical protein [Prevotella pallens]
MKDLAEAYLAKAQENAIRFKDINFFNGPLYQESDIKAAFNAGRESVVENMPKLKWSKAFEDGLYIAISSFGVSYRIKFAYNEFHLFCNSVYISCYISLSDAKQAANEHYKKQIKKALGV